MTQSLLGRGLFKVILNTFTVLNIACRPQFMGLIGLIGLIGALVIWGDTRQ